MSDLYDKIRQDMQSRREVVGKAGLGFEISVQKAVVGPNGPKIKSKSPLGNGCKCLIQESTLATPLGWLFESETLSKHTVTVERVGN